jgi:hypothetical protein
MTLANMRMNGVRAVIATCEVCGHKGRGLLRPIHVDTRRRLRGLKHANRGYPPTAVNESSPTRSAHSYFGPGTERFANCAPFLLPQIGREASWLSRLLSLGSVKSCFRNFSAPGKLSRTVLRHNTRPVVADDFKLLPTPHRG